MHTPKTMPRWRLSEARNLRDWSQHEVADRIGTTTVNISRWERGITKPGPYFRRKLCALFGKSEEELDLVPIVNGTNVDGSNLDEAVTDRATGGGAIEDRATGDRATGGGATEVRATGDRATARVAPTMDVVSPGGVDTALFDPTIPLLSAVQLVGREDEFAKIKQRLCRVGGLSTLNGLPGVGKTALSIALAHDQEIREHFRDGVLWAGLGPHPNIAGLLSRWGTLLGVSPTEMATLSSTSDWSRALRTAIGSRSMLLVIDDAWQVEDALSFRVGGPNCAHLVTTRFPHIAMHIAIDGATVLRELNEKASMMLLRLLAPGVVEREAKKATDLIHAVGGLPLALTLMGNYLRKEAYSGQARRVSAALERLSDAEERLHIAEPHGPVESHSSLTPETPLSLQSVLAVTDQQLHEQARAALYALSVFPAKPDSFSEQAALAVAGCTVNMLDVLTDTGLLESSGSGRYTLHQTVADYARLHLQQGEAVYHCLIAYAIDLVEAHKKDYELLELESSTILTALEAAYERGMRVELVRAVGAFAPFLLLRGLYTLAEDHLKRAYDAAGALEDPLGMTTVLLYLGEIAQKQGHYTQAEACYQDGLTLARQVGDSERISALLTNLGWVALKRGEYAQAERYLKEGLALARQIENLERISGLLEMLGSVAGSRGDYAQSEAFLKEGLVIARQVGDRERICTVLINLGATAADRGDDFQAKAYYQEGLILARQIGHREWIGLLLINLGATAIDQGDYIQAESYFREGLELARQIGHREWSGVLLINLGLTAQRQGKYSEADVYLQESLNLSRQIGIPQITANALYEYGNLYLHQQQLEVAEATFREMLAAVPEGDQDLRALAQYGLARAVAAQGNVQAAWQLGEMSLTSLETLGHRATNEVRLWLASIKD
ncbi:MAG: hypothetical protein NVSMB27_35030 [Ktedonobacteraceae bacterium]